MVRQSRDCYTYRHRSASIGFGISSLSLSLSLSFLSSFPPRQRRTLPLIFQLDVPELSNPLAGYIRPYSSGPPSTPPLTRSLVHVPRTYCSVETADTNTKHELFSDHARTHLNVHPRRKATLFHTSELTLRKVRLREKTMAFTSLLFPGQYPIRTRRAGTIVRLFC